MECDLTAADGDTPNDNQTESDTPVGDWLDKCCAYWMMMGVPYNEFWNGDYTSFKYYAMQRDYEKKQRNADMWLQGMYIYDAISVVASHMADKHSRAEYPKEPYRIFPPSEDEKEAENKRKVVEFRNQLNALCGRMEAKHRREAANDENRSVVIASGS